MTVPFWIVPWLTVKICALTRANAESVGGQFPSHALEGTERCYDFCLEAVLALIFDDSVHEDFCDGIRSQVEEMSVEKNEVCVLSLLRCSRFDHRAS